MILRRGSVATSRVEGSASWRTEERLADAGGLRTLGVNICTLGPGEGSALRHWHEEEDEFLMMLEGEAVVIENDGEHAVGPGDVCCWPAGVDNAHHVLNRSDAPVRYLVAGNGPRRDVVHYPDDDRTLFREPDSWRIVAGDGTVLREGGTGGG